MAPPFFLYLMEIGQEIFENCELGGGAPREVGTSSRLYGKAWPQAQAAFGGGE